MGRFEPVGLIVVIAALLKGCLLSSIDSSSPAKIKTPLEVATTNLVDLLYQPPTAPPPLQQIPKKVQVGNASRERLDLEDLVWLRQLDIPPDRPEMFSKQTKHNRALRWIDERLKQNLVLYGRLASAAYCNRDRVIGWACGERCQKVPGFNIVEYFDNERTSVAGFLAVNEAAREIVISFRGSRTLKNWLYNLYASKRSVPWRLYCFGLKTPKVHQGFFLAYESVKMDVLAMAQRWFKQYPRYSIHVTGHSLGGALATLCAMELNEILSFKAHIRFTTFQSPRIGNEAFAKLVHYHFPDPHDRIRVTHGRDIVPRLPPYFMGFRHAAMEVFIPPQATYNTTGLLCDATSGEDSRCTNAYVAYSIDDHLALPWGIDFGVPCK